MAPTNAELDRPSDHNARHDDGPHISHNSHADAEKHLAEKFAEKFVVVEASFKSFKNIVTQHLARHSTSATVPPWAGEVARALDQLSNDIQNLTTKIQSESSSKLPAQANPIATSDPTPAATDSSHPPPPTKNKQVNASGKEGISGDVQAEGPQDTHRPGDRAAAPQLRAASGGSGPGLSSAPAPEIPPSTTSTATPIEGSQNGLNSSTSAGASGSSSALPSKPPSQQDSTSSSVSQPQGGTRDTELSSAPTFRCAFADIFNHDEPTFDKICRDRRVQEYGFVKIEIDGLPPLNIDKGSMRRPNKDDHSVHFRYEADGPSVKVAPAPKLQTKLPTFPLPETAKKVWTRAELKHFVEETCSNPPKGAAYVIGTQLFPYPELGPSEKTKRRGEGKLAGVNSPYQYFSASGGPTMTVLHHEDGNLGSKNVMLGGAHKVLVVIKPGSNKQFEVCMHDKFPGARRDSQSIRHINRLVSPSLLEEWGVEYDIAYIAPGQGFVTLPGAVYHMVINMGDNLALAVNWEPPSSPDMPEGYVWCDKTCDDRPLTADDFRLSEDVPQIRRASQRGAAAPSTSIAKKRARTDLPENSPPEPKKRSVDSHKPRALRDFIRSTKAIDEHLTRIRAFRALDTPMKARLRASVAAGAGEIDGLIEHFGGGELLQRFLRRLMQVSQEQKFEEEKNKLDLRRANSALMKAQLERRGWEANDETRKRLQNERKRPARLAKLCSGKYLGLLSFLPHNQALVEMRTAEIEMFHSLVHRDKEILALCKLGRGFEDAIFGKGKVPHYPLEEKSLIEREDMSFASQVALLTCGESS